MRPAVDVDHAFLAALQALAGAPPPATGTLFEPTSVFWRVNREAVLFLGGMRALLLQLAHSKVAQAVADHSRYHHDPLGRAHRTFTAVHAMVFGTPAAAVAAARRVDAIHRRVQGEIADPVPAMAEPQYAATDPPLLLWVEATLVDSALQTYELVFGRLDPTARERYYQESRRAAVLFGLDPATLPADWAAFQHWFAQALASPAITVTPTARAEAHALLHGSWLARLVQPLNASLAAGMLPPPLRAGYGLRWGVRQRLLFHTAVLGARVIVRCLPWSLRAVPAARRAERDHMTQQCRSG